jgi:trimeric autotransporter adhesin
MRAVRWGLTLVTAMIALLGACYGAAAQVATTTIQDTVYRADGTPANGTVVVTWPTFTTAAGQAVAAGNTSLTLGPNGALSVSLTANVGATPAGSYYTAVLHLDDGTTSQQYWVVPVSGTPVTLATIESQVLPTSVAMQTASKQYVDQAIAQISGGTTQTTTYVPTTGGTMTGPLVLPGDPVTPTQAADKHYVDTNITAVLAGVGQKVSLLPFATQTISQPTGTQLQVNVLNGELYADQFQTGDGGNGIANALASQNCGSDCIVIADPSYTSGEPVITAQIPNAGRVVDLRNGAKVETYVNPVSPSGNSTAESLSQISTNTDANSPVAGSGVGSTRLTFSVSNAAMAGGSNQLPGEIENVPYGKANYGVSLQTGNYFTEGQHVQDEHVINCYAVGDCLEGSWFLTSSGGYRDEADEGAHPFDLQVSEDNDAFQGTCSSGCTTGSTSLFVVATVRGGTQGEGRFLIDKNPAKTINSGQLVSGGVNVLPLANFTGTNFPVSVFMQTAVAATSQPKNIAPGAVTLSMVTSGAPAGFAVNTSQLPSQSGVACIADTNDVRFPNFETANYTVVDASHITFTLNNVHGAGAVIAVGGLCGYGIEQTVDTMGSVRQVFPVVGSPNGTELFYAAASTLTLGNGGLASTSGYQNISVQIASLARQGNVVTATLARNTPVDVNELTMTVSGVADASYNGSFQVTSVGGNQLTYSNTGPDSTSTGGTVSLLTGGYVLYPMAEILSVYNASTKQVDGQLTLAANTMAWAAGDAVEIPHYYQQLTDADTEFVTQFVPRPTQFSSAGKQYQGQVGPGMRGWQITNAVPGSNYLGAGGTHELPDDAYVVSGPWSTDFEVDAGTLSLIRAHCNVHGCNRWDSGYSLFALDSATGEDFLFYSPNSSTASWSLGGQSFTFAPTGFTANNVKASTLAVGQSKQFAVDVAGNVAGSTLNLAGGATGSNYDLNIVDNTQNQAYIGTTDNGGYAVFRFATPTQVWQFADGGHNSAVPDTWYVYDQTHTTTAFSIQGGTESATFAGSVSAPEYIGPSTAPTGSCSTNGAWVFSQDGHATFCSAGTWVTKI